MELKMEFSIAKPICDLLVQWNSGDTVDGQSLDQVLADVTEEIQQGSNEPGWKFYLLVTFCLSFLLL